MGYYSHVAISIHKDLFRKLKDTRFKEVFLQDIPKHVKDNYAELYQNEDYIILFYREIKWYTSYADIGMIEGFLIEYSKTGLVNRIQVGADEEYEAIQKSGCGIALVEEEIGDVDEDLEDDGVRRFIECDMGDLTLNEYLDYFKTNTQLLLEEE